MKFRELSQYLKRLEETPSRNEITEILASLFRETQSSEISKVVYLILGKLAPNYEGIILNIADRLMIRIIAKTYDTSDEEVNDLYKKSGDLGETSEKLALEKNIKGSDPSVLDVFEKLIEIAADSGGGSQDRKVTETSVLLKSLDPLSVRFVARIPVGKLRLGFSDMTILDALSFMLKGDKSARKEIEAAFNVTVDTGKIAEIIKAKGLRGLMGIEPDPGTPIRPSLCERLPSAEKILEKVGSPLVVEPKYDGFRCQCHIWEESGERKVRIFSRNMELTTHMFPDLVEAVKSLKVKSAIFDGEAIAFDSINNKFLPFQETIQRKRKHGISEAVESIPLKLFLFDILYKDGQGLLNLPFNERRKILSTVVPVRGEKVELTRQDIVSDPDAIRDLIKKYLSEGLEGAVLKKVDAIYKAGGRGYHWVKYKKHTVKGVADTIDLLVMGVNVGKGKRAGFGAGGFLVGIKDKNTFKSVSKIGTGLSDDQWRELNERSKSLGVSEKPKEYDVDKNLFPSVWLKPSLVVEILADEITKSPIHRAGLALRFPRLIKFRDDKSPSDITTLKELEQLFEMQKVL
jgi:DNA ligase 1